MVACVGFLRVSFHAYFDNELLDSVTLASIETISTRVTAGSSRSVGASAVAPALASAALTNGKYWGSAYLSDRRFLLQHRPRLIHGGDPRQFHRYDETA